MTKRINYIDLTPELKTKEYNTLIMGIIFLGLLITTIIANNTIVATFVNTHLVPVIIGYIILALIGVMMSIHSDRPMISFIGYLLVVSPTGMLLSAVIEEYGGISSSVVINAFIITMIITILFAISGFIFPNFYDKIGSILLVSLAGLIIVQIIFMLIGIDPTWMSFIGATIFSLYIGYDIHKAQTRRHTVDNAIDAAVGLHLDIINLFLHILSISNGSSDD